MLTHPTRYWNYLCDIKCIDSFFFSYASALWTSVEAMAFFPPSVDEFPKLETRSNQVSSLGYHTFSWHQGSVGLLVGIIKNIARSQKAALKTSHRLSNVSSCSYQNYWESTGKELRKYWKNTKKLQRKYRESIAVLRKHWKSTEKVLRMYQNQPCKEGMADSVECRV